LLCHELLQTSILFLKGFEFLRYLWLHPSVFLTPAVVSLLTKYRASCRSLEPCFPLPGSTSA
jgi:hypothetical protein